jgi:hypothetical protein
MVQWRTELLRFTPPGFFSIYFYHGPKRETDPRKLAQARGAARAARSSSRDLISHPSSPALACSPARNKSSPDLP